MKERALVLISILFLSGSAYGQEGSKAGVYDREYYKSGQLRYEMIINGPEDGESEGIAVSKGYYENGQLEYEVIAKDGNVEYGIYKEYYRNGQLKELNHFKNDEYHGICLSYNERGQLLRVVIYEDGRIIDWKNYHYEKYSFWG